jgi:aryl-alcohol dehydrogenase-like predicted oxidoreductase
MQLGSPKATPSVHGLWVVAAWAIAIALAYAGAGAWLAGAVEGISPAHLPTWTVLCTALGTVVALVLSLLWASQPGRQAGNAAAPAPDLDRRRFLARAITVGAGGVSGVSIAVLGRNLEWLTREAATPDALPSDAATPRAEWAGSCIRQYRTLGRTGFETSDISVCASALRPESGGYELARELIARGVNYFDTAPDYSAGGSELALGCALHGQRQRIFVSTKFCTPGGHLPARAPVADYVQAVEGSLRRLRTEYVDLVYVHSCNGVERLLCENAHEAFDRLKGQGKVRFLGVSAGATSPEAVAEAAIASGRFDVMMLAYQRGAWPHLSRIVARAAAAGIGIVATELLQGARDEGLLDRLRERDSYPQAAFRWALRNPDVAALAVPFREPRHIDEYLYASGQRAGRGDPERVLL